MRVYLALYKGCKDGRGLKVWLARAADWVIRAITGSPYSHCEIVIQRSHDNQFDCYSASARDGGVRMKTMPLPADKWDLIPVPDAVAESASRLFRRTNGLGYDWAGVFGLVLKTPHRRGRWFCSEWCAAAIGRPFPQRYTPGKLAGWAKYFGMLS